VSLVAAHAPFDLVLCDPPWADLPRAVRALARLCSTVGLVSGARVVLEHSAADEPELDENADLGLVTRRAWGDTAVSVFTFSAS
jgi:16S rRNA G966 N2-methylase RsmD